MGFWPINKVTIERVFDSQRKLVVRWTDAVIGVEETKEFGVDELAAAAKFAQDRLNEVAM